MHKLFRILSVFTVASLILRMSIRFASNIISTKKWWRNKIQINVIMGEQTMPLLRTNHTLVCLLFLFYIKFEYVFIEEKIGMIIIYVYNIYLAITYVFFFPFFFICKQIIPTR